MLKFIISLLCIGIAAAAGPYLAGSQGLVQIVTQNYEISTSITVAAAIIAVVYVVLLVVIGLILKITRFPAAAKSFFRRRTKDKAASLNTRAVTAYELGDYERSLTLVNDLKKLKQLTPEALFSAAKSAFALGDYRKTRDLLDEAQKLGGEVKNAVAVIRTKLNLKLKNPQAALEVLNEAKNKVSSKLGAELAYQCCLREDDLKSLQEMIPQLLKYNIINDKEAKKIKLAYINKKLKAADSGQEIKRIWDTFSRNDKKNPAIAGAVISRMITAGDIDNARKICLNLLKDNHDAEILELIASWNISIPEVLELLKSQASGNLIASQVNVPLLKAMGNLELHEGMLKEAQEHYEQAFALNKSADICLKLASIMSSQRRYDQAALYYEKAFRAGANQLLAKS